MTPFLLCQFEEILEGMIKQGLINIVGWSHIFLLFEDERDETGVGFEIGKPRLLKKLSVG